MEKQRAARIGQEASPLAKQYLQTRCRPPQARRNAINQRWNWPSSIAKLQTPGGCSPLGRFSAAAHAIATSSPILLAALARGKWARTVGNLHFGLASALPADRRVAGDQRIAPAHPILAANLRGLDPECAHDADSHSRRVNRCRRRSCVSRTPSFRISIACSERHHLRIPSLSQ